MARRKEAEAKAAEAREQKLARFTTPAEKAATEKAAKGAEEAREEVQLAARAKVEKERGVAKARAVKPEKAVSPPAAPPPPASGKVPAPQADVRENAQQIEAAVTGAVDVIWAVGALFKEKQEERAAEEKRRAEERAVARAKAAEERAKEAEEEAAAEAAAAAVREAEEAAAKAAAEAEAEERQIRVLYREVQLTSQE